MRRHLRPGAIHLLNGLYDAKLDHVPMVALVGQTNRSAMGGSYQQEVDLHSLFKDVASDFCETATVPEQLPNLIDRAIRTAYARRSVTAIIIPADVQELDHTPPKHAFKMVPSSIGTGNRHRPAHDRAALPLRGQPGGRRPRDAPAAVAAAAPQGEPHLAGEGGEGRHPLVGGDAARAAAAAVLQGDSDTASVLKQGIKAKVQEFLPGTRHRS